MSARKSRGQQGSPITDSGSWWLLDCLGGHFDLHGVAKLLGDDPFICSSSFQQANEGGLCPVQWHDVLEQDPKHKQVKRPVTAAIKITSMSWLLFFFLLLSWSMNRRWIHTLGFQQHWGGWWRRGCRRHPTWVFPPQEQAQWQGWRCSRTQRSRCELQPCERRRSCRSHGPSSTDSLST